MSVRLESLCPGPGCRGTLQLDESSGLWSCQTCRRTMEFQRPTGTGVSEILARWVECRDAGGCNHPAQHHPVADLIVEIQRLTAENERLMAAVHREAGA